MALFDENSEDEPKRYLLKWHANIVEIVNDLLGGSIRKRINRCNDIELAHGSFDYPLLGRLLYTMFTISSKPTGECDCLFGSPRKTVISEEKCPVGCSVTVEAAFLLNCPMMDFIRVIMPMLGYSFQVVEDDSYDVFMTR